MARYWIAEYSIPRYGTCNYCKYSCEGQSLPSLSPFILSILPSSVLSSFLPQGSKASQISERRGPKTRTRKGCKEAGTQQETAGKYICNHVFQSLPNMSASLIRCPCLCLLKLKVSWFLHVYYLIWDLDGTMFKDGLRIHNFWVMPSTYLPLTLRGLISLGATVGPLLVVGYNMVGGGGGGAL